MSWFSGPPASSIVTASIHVRSECPECGSPLLVPGLRSELECKACQSRVPVGREFWSGLFFRLHTAFPSRSQVSLSLAGAMSSELPIYARFAAEHPFCVHCRGPLRIDLRPIGTTGPTPCSGCAWTTPSYPAPDWLRSEFADLQQFFEPAPPPPPGPASSRPVGFTCPECGGKLKLTEGTRRLVDCQYCEHTLFLPPELWHAMHPVQKRTPWWVAFVR